ncbi:hypothetical protein KCP73_08740 [Salmonella enterica subsp. enterica]|nr:hypothetical protein KCP73_08740 [Salmonella enterica subsp. enterica]
MRNPCDQKSPQRQPPSRLTVSYRESLSGLHPHFPPSPYEGQWWKPPVSPPVPRWM